MSYQIERSELIQKSLLADSDGDLLARLFAEHNAALVRFLRLRLNSDQDAHDVAQEAYIRILQLDKPGAVSFLRGYLFRVAANIATDRLRHGRVRRTAHGDPAFGPCIDEIDPERDAIARQQLGILEASLRELPDKIRNAFLLQRMNGISAAEAGRRLGISERTASLYVLKALVHCKKRMDEAGEGTASDIKGTGLK